VPLVFPSVLSLDLKFVSLVFHAGVTCVVDLSVWVSAAYFHLGSGPHRCSSFSCSSPSPHFHEALFLVRLAERRLGSVSIHLQVNFSLKNFSRPCSLFPVAFGIWSRPLSRERTCDFLVPAKCHQLVLRPRVFFLARCLRVVFFCRCRSRGSVSYPFLRSVPPIDFPVIGGAAMFLDCLVVNSPARDLVSSLEPLLPSLSLL
jgi:hypothetical protein